MNLRVEGLWKIFLFARYTSNNGGHTSFACQTFFEYLRKTGLTKGSMVQTVLSGSNPRGAGRKRKGVWRHSHSQKIAQINHLHFFQRQQACINVSTFFASHFVRFFVVHATLRAREVDQAQLT